MFYESTIQQNSSNQEKKDQILEVMADIGNIEFCLDFLIKLANNNIHKKPTGISIFQSENSGSQAKVKDLNNLKSMHSKKQEVDDEIF